MTERNPRNSVPRSILPLPSRSATPSEREEVLYIPYYILKLACSANGSSPFHKRAERKQRVLDSKPNQTHILIYPSCLHPTLFSSCSPVLKYTPNLSRLIISHKSACPSPSPTNYNLSMRSWLLYTSPTARVYGSKEHGYHGCTQIGHSRIYTLYIFDFIAFGTDFKGFWRASSPHCWRSPSSDA